jgi:hypothetical protein
MIWPSTIYPPAMSFPRADRMRCRSTARSSLGLQLSPQWSERPRSRSRGRKIGMLQSHVVDVDGTFVGAAIRQSDGYRFVAVDVRLDELDGVVWPTLAEVRRNARIAFVLGRPPVVEVQAPCIT